MDTKKLRQKILDLAIRGKLVPQDPSDEPASLLLARIRAEKERLIKEGKIKRSKKAATDEDIEAPFEIPESWEWTKLDDILLLLSGQDFPPTKYNSESKGLPYIIGASNIDNEKLLVNRWTETPSVVSKLNDVLVVCKGAGVGKIAMNDVGDVHIARQIQAVRDETGIINSKYIKLCIASNISSIIANANGLIPGLKRELLLSLMVPIAPIAEQERIVSAVEHLYSYIDALESNEGDLLKAIDQAKSKILDLAIHGKLVPQDPNDEPAINLLKRINPKFEACDEDCYEVPEGWTFCKLQDVFNITMGSSPTGESLNRIGEGIEFHQGKLCFTELYLEKSEVYTTQSIKLASPYSILLCVRAPVGIVNINEREVCIGRGLCSLAPLGAMNLMYGFYALKTCQMDFEQKATGSTFKAISGNDVKTQLIPLPPYQEQLRIVAKIEELFGVLDGIKETLEAK